MLFMKNQNIFKMNKEIYIILIKVDYTNARKLCERNERTTFTSIDYNGTGARWIYDVLTRNNPDLSNSHLLVYDMSNFMDLLNNQDINMDDYFMSYVFYQRDTNFIK